MATAVLRPQDCLQNRQHLDAFRLYRPPPANPPRKKSPQPPLSSQHSLPSPSSSAELCRRVPSLSPRSRPPRKTGSVSGVRQTRARLRQPPFRTDGTVSEGDTRSGTVLEMGQVRILKRGEELKLAVSVTTPDLVPVGISPKRIDTVPHISPSKMFGHQRPKAYAGPAYIVSPSPDSLPFPSPLLIHRMPTKLRHA